MTAHGTEQDQYTRRTLAAVAAVIVEHALAPARRRRRRALMLLGTGAVLSGLLGWWGIASRESATMVIATGCAVATCIVGIRRAPSWSDVSVDGSGLFHTPGALGEERILRNRHLTERLLLELRRQADGVTYAGRSPYPTSAAVDANLERIGALDLYHLPAQALVVGQLGAPARRWVERVAPGCVDGAVALAATSGYRERTVGEVTAATARALREPLPAAFGAVTPPTAHRTTSGRLPVGVLLALVGVLGVGLAAGSAWTVLDGFGSRRYVSLVGRLDLTGAAAVSAGLASATPTHRFLLDDEGLVAVVDDTGSPVRTDATNRPVGAPTGRLVAVSVDPTSIPAGTVTVYRTDRGDWTVHRGSARFTQPRPGAWSLWALAALSVTGLGCIVRALVDARRDAKSGDEHRSKNLPLW